MTDSMLTSELKQEITRLYHYDGPAHPEWSAQAVRVSLGALHAFLSANWDSDGEDYDGSYVLVHWAFEEGMFPELAKLVDVSPAGVTWRPGVDPALREAISAFAAPQFKLKHRRPRLG